MAKKKIIAFPKQEEQTTNMPSMPSAPTSIRLLLTAEEAAKALAIHRSTLYQFVQRNAIPSIKIRNARCFPLAWLERWIAEQLEDAA